ncbi:hypothetical protein Tco_0507685 [Tanacetum coccineum]
MQVLMLWLNMKHIEAVEMAMIAMSLHAMDEVEKYVRGLLDMIQGSVMAFKPKTMQDAIEFATELMDKKIRSLADRQAENKRKLDELHVIQPEQQSLFNRH